jgi:hypothetical protein
MISFLIKSILTLCSLCFTVFLFVTGSWGWGITFIFVSALFVFFFIRNENILLALNQMRLGNHEKAYVYLQRITQPGLLIFNRQKAYFYYLSGMLGARDLGMSKSEQYIRKALSIGLKQDQDKAIANMHLGAICMQTGRKNDASSFLAEAKRLDKNNVLGEQLKQLKKQSAQVASKNQMRMVQMGGSRMRSRKMR